VLVTWLIVDRVGVRLDQLSGLQPSDWLPAPVPLVGASLLLLIAYFFSAALWGRIVRDLGGPKLAARESIRLFMIANLGRYIPGKIWQIAGLAALAKNRGVPPVTGAGAALLGQGLALIAASAIGMGALLAAPEPYPTIGMFGALVVLALGALVAVPKVFETIAGLWFRLARTQAPEALGSVHALRWLGLYVVNWALYALAFWLLVVGLDLGGGLVPVASAFAAAYVLGYVMVFAPAGLGPREGFLIAFLTPHVGPGPSGVIAVVARLWTTAVEVVPASLFWAQYVGASGSPEAAGEGDA
jgi:uncharacterized membrane protein YbhN (UPF0104 family)